MMRLPRGRRLPPSAHAHGLHVRSPSQVIAVGFAAAIGVGTLLLSLPVARRGDGGASLLEALFTATSAVCVTGLAVVDTATYWTPFGLVVILALVQVGGFGIMTVASLLGLAMARRIGMRARLNTVAETKSAGVGDLRSVLVGVVRTTVVIESVVAVLLAARFALGYGEPVPRALWLGLFHSVSAFNNAGFALWTDNLIPFATDAWVCLPIAAAVIAGALGFPVIHQLRRHGWDLLHWTMNTRVVLLGTAVLLVGGTVVITVSEWRNEGTLGQYDTRGRLLVGFFQAVMPRTAGFNSVDVGQLNPETLLALDVLMFIGGGPAGTAGGIKITTFFVLLFVILAEVRGDTSVIVLGKRLPQQVQRQALSVALLAVAVVVLATAALLAMTDFSLDQTLFEAVSAFATVGLSTGITAQLPTAGQLILVVLMFVGRLGPITFATALALRERTRLYELPKERPIIG